MSTTEDPAALSDLSPAVTVTESSADACTALGCRRYSSLYRVSVKGFGERVLCAEHAEELIQREVDGR